MIVIYSEIESPRFNYVCEFIFGRVLNRDYKVCHTNGEYIQAEGHKINYSNQSVAGLQIVPNSFISETEVGPIELASGIWKNLPVLFTTAKGDIPFDIFSAVFYLISRYEEYVPSERDMHDRFLSENSILFKLEILDKPIVDLWCQKLQETLTGEIKINRAYNFISTIDVDNAYAYNFKSFVVKLGGTIKSLFKGSKEDLKRRFGCYFRQKADPYDTYDFISETHRSVGIKGTYFFLLSDRNDWDRNLSYTNKHYRGLILALQRENNIGIHPGYNSYINEDRMLTEKLRLEDIVDQPVTKSRQHFLKFKFPETPRFLLKSGIKEDYSLGYAEALGFRAGTCTPFLFFDLLRNSSTDLLMHSSCLMDATLNRYLRLNPEQALTRAAELTDHVKAVNGEMITIWHNETLSEMHEWKGWSGVFKELVLASVLKEKS